MVKRQAGSAEKGFKSEEDMPRRVAPRLEGVVKNKGTDKKKKPKTKYSNN